MAIGSMKELEEIIQLTEEEKAWREDGGNTLPLLVSDNLIPLLSCPSIRRQFVPSVLENTDPVGNLDPQMEKEHSVTPRLVRRYRNRAAFMVTDGCFAYCRHCFRRRFAGSMVGKASVEEIQEAATFLKASPEIKEVLLTGGDLFTLSDKDLDQLLSLFKEARPDIIYRLCSRTLVSNPDRFTPAFFSVLEKHNHGAPFYFMTQFNHPLELTGKAKEAIKGFIRLGIPMLNQCVLLKGVNDSLETQVELCNLLLMNRIKPHYLFQGDLVQGTGHLRVPLSEGLKLEKEMREELSGLSMPAFTLDLPEGGGKVPLHTSELQGLQNGIWTICTPEGEIRRYPEDKR